MAPSPPDIDSTFLPFFCKAYNRRACICKTAKCRELTSLFQAQKDQRGSHFALPTTREETTKKELAEVKARKSHLAKWHLNVNDKDAETFDRRNQRKDGSPLRTRASKVEVKSERKYVACHHFHPRVLLFSSKNQKYHWADTLPVDWVRANIQNGGTNDNGYSNNDKMKDKKSTCDYIMVPSYPSNAAESDYTLLERTMSIRATVAEVTTTPATRRTSSILTTGSLRRTSIGSSTPRSTSSSGTSTPGSARSMSSTGTTTSRIRFSFGSTSSSASTANSSRALGGADNNTQLLEETIRHLTERNNQLQAQNAQAQATINNLMASEGASDAILSSDYGLQGKYGGINRLSITSDKFHQVNGKLASELFGFETWEYTKAFLKAMFWLDHEEPTPSRLGSRLTKFEQCLIALIHLETGYSQLTIAFFFGLKGHTQVSQCINLWVPEWGRVGEDLSVLPFIDSAFLDTTEPQSYIDLDLRKVGAIVDGKDFYTETVRKDRVVSTAQQGNKLGKSSFRILTWSTPTGLVFEHTKPIFARTTEKKLNDLWAKHGRLRIPPGYIISGDKGFQGTSGMYPNHNTVIHPAFLHGEAQFSEAKIGWNHRACQLRYTCETVYSRVTNRNTLYGFVPRNRFHLFEDTCGWGHGRANLYLPLQMPKNSENYFQVSKRHQANRKRKRSMEA